MNKKGAALPMEQIVGIIILVVLLLVFAGAFFRPEKGWLNYVGDKAESFARFIPGRDKIPHVPNLEAPSGIQEAYDSLYETFRQLKDLDQNECWAEYDEIPELNKITILLTDTTEGLNMRIINEKGQTLDPQPLDGLNPCIIGGTASDGSNSVRNFDLYHDLRFDSSYDKGSLVYNEVKTITIQEEGFLQKGEDMEADGVLYDLDRTNLLYKHDSGHICFIPTVGGGFSSGCESNSLKGLDNDCIALVKNKVDRCNI